MSSPVLYATDDANFRAADKQVPESVSTHPENLGPQFFGGYIMVEPRVTICKDAYPCHGHSVAGGSPFFVRSLLIRDFDVSRNHSDGYLVSPLP